MEKEWNVGGKNNKCNDLNTMTVTEKNIDMNGDSIDVFNFAQEKNNKKKPCGYIPGVGLASF